MKNESYSSENSNLNGNLTNEPNSNLQTDITPPKQNPLNNKSLLGVFELLSISWKMFQERWIKFILLALLLIAIQVAAQFLLGLALMPLIFSLFIAPGQFSFIVLFTAMAVMVIIMSVPSFLISISIIEIIKDKNLGIIESINKALGKLIPYIKVSIIGGLIMVGFFALLFASTGLLFAGLSYALGSSSPILMSVLNIIDWLLGFVMILAIFPIMLVMQIWIFFSLLAVVLEGMRPIAALSYSYELIKGKLRSIVWKFIVVVALFMLIVLGMFILMAIIEDLSALIVPLIFIFYFIGIFTLLIFYYNVYENLKAIKISEIPEDFEAKNSGKIKLLAIGGAAIIGLVLTASVFFTPQFMREFSDFMP